MYKWASYILIFCAALVGFGFKSPPTAGKKQWVVVIDAGHGGKDPGCHGVKFKEKNIALAVSLKLGHYLQDNDKDVKVVYTRTTDVFVPLNERADIANKNHADFFICIHLNASPNHDANGSATYVMRTGKADANLEVEKRENSSILLEKNYKTTYGGYDPDSPTGNIIFSMYQNLYLTQSLDLAAKIQDEYSHIEKRKNNSVKQAGFLVLWRTAMPSLLTEIGFLTNPDEEKYMGSQKGEDDIAKAIFLAFEQYKSEKDNTSYNPKDYTFKQFVVQSGDTARMDTTQHNQIPDSIVNPSFPRDTMQKTPPKKQHTNDSVIPKKVDSVPVKQAPKDTSTAKVNRMKDALKGLKVDSVPRKKIDSVPPKPKKVVDTATKKTTIVKPAVTDTSKICFKVQFILSDHQLPKNDKRFEGMSDIDFYVDNKTYKYTAGCYSQLSDASMLQKKLRDQGYKDAFIVAFKGKRRITIKEAQGK